MESQGTILYVGGFELPDKNAAAHRVINNARAFKELGYNVVFCGVDKDIKENCNQPQTAAGFCSYPLAYPISTKKWAKQMLDVSHYINILEKYSDATHVICYNLHAVPLKRLLRYAKKRRIKIIADCTEWYENKFSLHPIKLIKWMDTILCMQVLQKKCDGIIAISSYLENYYNKYVENIVVVPPLIDAEEEKWKQTKGLFTDKISFVYSGQPGDTKDKIGQITDCFLKTGAADKCVFRVVGITMDEFLKTYPQSEEQKEEIGSFVQFFGRVSHTESIQQLMNADYCIFIRDKSRKNMAGFPTKFVECYTSGINIIANKISDIEKYFPQSDSSILIENNSNEEICEAIDKVLRASKPTRHDRQENPFDYREWKDKYEKFLSK